MCGASAQSYCETPTSPCRSSPTPAREPAPPDEIVVEQGFDAEVETAFNSLPDKFRDVVQLVDIDGLAYQEAADRLGVPVGTIMSRLHRARKRIKKQLEGTGIGVRRGNP